MPRPGSGYSGGHPASPSVEAGRVARGVSVARAAAVAVLLEVALVLGYRFQREAAGLSSIAINVFTCLMGQHLNRCKLLVNKLVAVMCW